MQPLLDALANLGAHAMSLRGNGCPPVRVEADGLEGGTARMPGGVSSQYFSALLLVGPCREARNESRGRRRSEESKPYIDVTAQAMRPSGRTMTNAKSTEASKCARAAYSATTYRVEPDASAASYFFAAAAVTGGQRGRPRARDGLAAG